MKKKLMIYVALLLFVQFALASLTIEENYSIQTDYLSGDEISGLVNLSVSNEAADSLFTSNLNGSITLEDFLRANGESGFCSTSNCISDYSYSTPTQTKTVNVVAGTEHKVGFLITGNSVSISKFDFDLASSYPESGVEPLSLDFPGLIWSEDTFSGNYANPILTHSPTAPFGLQFMAAAEYCQDIPLPKTNSIRIKPYIEESFLENITVKMYSESSSLFGQCDYSHGSEGCVIDPFDNDILEGDYYICVSDTGGQAINLKFENSSAVSNGYIHFNGNFNPSNKNYFIEVGPETYADSSALNLTSYINDLPAAASSYISSNYNGDCTGGCILPLVISGVPQEMVFSNLDLQYVRSSDGGTQETNFYSIEESAPMVNFNGEVDLDRLGLVIDEDQDQFVLYFDGDEIIKENITVSSNIITNVYPREVPAGIPIEFIIASDMNVSGVVFNWSFGDNVTETSVEKNITHTYLEIKNYTLSVSAKKNNLTEMKTFQISVVSPVDIINTLLAKKSGILNDLENKTSGIALSGEIRSALGLSYFRGELANIAIEFNNSNGDSDTIAVATKIFDLKIPVNFTIEERTDYIVPGEGDIDISILGTISGEGVSEGGVGLYKTAIQKWFANNIDINSKEKILTVHYEGSTESIEMRSYELEIDSKFNDTSYLVIDKARNLLNFTSGTAAVSSGQSTYVVLNPNEKKTIKISSFSSAAPSFFVSPKPSLLILDEDDLEVNEECNFDGICQEGENSSNCRDDCKPVGLFIGYVVFIVVLFLVVFVGVSIWYQRHKEEILFGDRKQLFNLVNFIDSARDKGVKDPEIVKALTEKGWVKERIDYAMQKSRSVDKISFSSFNNFIDKKIYANSAVTQTRQQAGQKINKPGFQGRSRKR